ncbi:septal ring lytic transglycosylase RlpA family protein [Leptolyngbya sp. FACHB-261]|uniref:septal ring lytic transglycosylase RlpA family protein n=1 Tax=Leptolyngbya sp. FACHB-261 TaxID=2692806 RepID=UPI001683FDF0|nr:septal ring lytic transglycosylase RlpA family protein [Leptolyngbya sp. FACHB-261]MBD2104811.1 septal ring lytic transglycosylase RlpA family protein [Leptolyngbya sp. FACHB-261]
MSQVVEMAPSLQSRLADFPRVQASSSGTTQVLVNERPILKLRDRERAEVIADQIGLMLVLNPELNADQIRPALVADVPVVRFRERVLFTIDRKLAAAQKRNSVSLLQDSLNRLRTALGERPLSMVEVQADLYNLKATRQRLKGLASWYGPRFNGRPTASGETFEQREFTAAHPTLPFNTFLQVTNRHTGSSVIVRVNDRGPYVKPRMLDLSRAAAYALGSTHPGVVPVEAVVMKPGS